jgi:hypothetical protein
MSETDVILFQLDRSRFIPKSDKWVTLSELKSESEISDSDVVSDQPHSDSSASNMSFSTITEQVRKKRVSNKSKKDRIVQKSLLLSARLGKSPPK